MGLFFIYAHPNRSYTGYADEQKALDAEWTQLAQIKDIKRNVKNMVVTDSKKQDSVDQARSAAEAAIEASRRSIATA